VQQVLHVKNEHDFVLLLLNVEIHGHHQVVTLAFKEKRTSKWGVAPLYDVFA